MRNRPGREAASWILENCKPDIRIVYADKRFALAGKFYEYVFEPVLAKNSAGFYAIGLHKFVAMIIYATSKDFQDDMLVLEAFGNTMASLDMGHLEQILDPERDRRLSDPMQYIVRFTRCHLDTIAESIAVLQSNDEVGSWILELSTTSLHLLLGSWGAGFERIQVYCDMSKPILAGRDVFSVFVGRKDKRYIDFGDGSEVPITYNLAGPIQLVDSRCVPGVQIADVISSCVLSAFRNPDKEISRKWLNSLKASFVRLIVPDWPQVDLRRQGPFVNRLVLEELVRRSEKGQDLLVNMEKVIEDALDSYRSFWLDNDLGN